VIGLLGASGAVGAHAARLLARHGWTGLRVGARHLDSVLPLVAGLPGDIEMAHVDATDDASLGRFVRGCSVVVNCAGPAHQLADRVALAAWAAGADYADAGGDAATAERVARRAPADTGRRAVFAAGAWPGLSGLFPRWLAASEFATVHTLTTYIGVRGRFTVTAASDYLDGALGRASEPLAAWRHGRRCSRALTRLTDASLPFFPGAVSALPYLDQEGEQVALALGLSRGSWYSVLPESWRGALDRARTRSHADAVADLCRAAEADAAGQPASTTLLAQLDGVADARARTRTGLLRGPGVSALSGTVAAVAALAVLRREVPPGVHCAATVLDPLRAVSWLGDEGPYDLTVLETSVEALCTLEEGVL
jgi:Saccharopine dehydrogenase NADP binding domain